MWYTRESPIQVRILLPPAASLERTCDCREGAELRIRYIAAEHRCTQWSKCTDRTHSSSAQPQLSCLQTGLAAPLLPRERNSCRRCERSSVIKFLYRQPIPTALRAVRKAISGSSDRFYHLTADRLLAKGASEGRQKLPCRTVSNSGHVPRQTSELPKLGCHTRIAREVGRSIEKFGKTVPTIGLPRSSRGPSRVRTSGRICALGGLRDRHRGGLRMMHDAIDRRTACRVRT
jgi:hypothetical protein